MQRSTIHRSPYFKLAGLGIMCLLAVDLRCQRVRADELQPDVPPQIKAAQEATANWWRDPKNQVAMVKSTHTDRYGEQHLTVVFILRDPNGRYLAVGRPGGSELQAFLDQRLETLLARAQQEYGLTTQDVEKLKLAADLDIARLNRRIQQVQLQLDTPEYRDDARKSNSLLTPITAACEGGLFNAGSLYARVLSTLLASR